MMLKVLFAIVTLLVASGVPQATQQNGVGPETGYVSDSRYINAFFGFSLPLPPGADFHDLVIPSNGNSHFLFGLQVQQKGLTALTVRATKSNGTSTGEARIAVAGQKSQPVKRIEIGSREFWKGESQQKSQVGKVRSLTYTTAIDGYVLQFMVVSFDAKLTNELERSIESISFFDPAQAKALAGTNARVFPTRSENGPKAPATPHHIGQLAIGTVSGNVFTNNALGFSFQFPEGWVVADKTTQERVVNSGHEFAWGNDPAAVREHEAVEQCSRILLWTSKYAEGTKTDEVNPLIAIIAFDSACLPGVEFPHSTTDTDAIRRLAIQISRSLAGTPFIGKGQSSVRAFEVQNRVMLDLSSAFKVDVPSRKQPFDAFTSVNFTEDNGYWVMWMFMNGSQSGLDELKKDVKIAFTPLTNGSRSKLD